MDDLIPFASREYWLLLTLVAFARGMDFLSTWFATPNLVLEGNPIAKKLGWRGGALLNVVICLAVARDPVASIAVSTTSLLVAARNFQSAWLMRTLGEEMYRDWHIAQLVRARVPGYLLGLAGNTLPIAAVGVAVIWFCGQQLIPSAIGLGIVVYALAVAFYTLLAFWQIRRAHARRMRGVQIQFANVPISPKMERAETEELKI
jgi:hypothetical protein